MSDPDAPDDPDRSVIRRDYLNGTAFPGIAAIRVMTKETSINHGSVTSPAGGDISTKLNYKQILKQETKALASRVIGEFEDVLTTLVKYQIVRSAHFPRSCWLCKMRI